MSPPAPTRFAAAVFALALLSSAGGAHGDARKDASSLKLATWNLEHLAARDGAGCKPREAKDYARLKRIAEKLDADVVAVQEVESEAALARVFDPRDWDLEVSTRPDEVPAPLCRDRPGEALVTQRTGFAVKKPLRYTRHADVTGLDVGGNAGDRYGVDITLEAGVPLRLLSVHLKSGCHTDPETSGREQCAIVYAQADVLKDWIGARAQDGIPFALLGDFNRRLQRQGDFWTALDSPGDPNADLSLPISAYAVSPCIERYPDFVDLVVFDPQSLRLFRPGSFHVLTYTGRERDFPSDHCPVSVILDLPNR